MTIDHHPVAAASAEQLIQRHPRHFGLDVPQRDIDGGNRAHRHGAAPPIGTAIEILPDILDPAGIHADQARNDMIFEIGNDRPLAPVQSGVANAVNALVGDYFQRHEIAARA
jgi:hypothetical protein